MMDFDRERQNIKNLYDLSCLEESDDDFIDVPLKNEDNIVQSRPSLQPQSDDHQKKGFFGRWIPFLGGTNSGSKSPKSNTRAPPSPKSQQTLNSLSTRFPVKKKNKKVDDEYDKRSYASFISLQREFSTNNNNMPSYETGESLLARSRALQALEGKDSDDDMVSIPSPKNEDDHPIENGDEGLLVCERPSEARLQSWDERRKIKTSQTSRNSQNTIENSNIVQERRSSIKQKGIPEEGTVMHRLSQKGRLSQERNSIPNPELVMERLSQSGIAFDVAEPQMNVRVSGIEQTYLGDRSVPGDTYHATYEKQPNGGMVAGQLQQENDDGQNQNISSRLTHGNTEETCGTGDRSVPGDTYHATYEKQPNGGMVAGQLQQENDDGQNQNISSRLTHGNTEETCGTAISFHIGDDSSEEEKWEQDNGWWDSPDNQGTACAPTHRVQSDLDRNPLQKGGLQPLIGSNNITVSSIPSYQQIHPSSSSNGHPVNTVPQRSSRSRRSGGSRSLLSEAPRPSTGPDPLSRLSFLSGGTNKLLSSTGHAVSSTAPPPKSNSDGVTRGKIARGKSLEEIISEQTTYLDSSASEGEDHVQLNGSNEPIQMTHEHRKSVSMEAEKYLHKRTMARKRISSDLLDDVKIPNGRSSDPLSMIARVSQFITKPFRRTYPPDPGTLQSHDYGNVPSSEDDKDSRSSDEREESETQGPGFVHRLSNYLFGPRDILSEEVELSPSPSEPMLDSTEKSSIRRSLEVLWNVVKPAEAPDDKESESDDVSSELESVEQVEERKSIVRRLSGYLIDKILPSGPVEETSHSPESSPVPVSQMPSQGLEIRSIRRRGKDSERDEVLMSNFNDELSPLSETSTSQKSKKAIPKSPQSGGSLWKWLSGKNTEKIQQTRPEPITFLQDEDCPENSLWLRYTLPTPKEINENEDKGIQSQHIKGPSINAFNAPEDARDRFPTVHTGSLDGSLHLRFGDGTPKKLRRSITTRSTAIPDGSPTATISDGTPTTYGTPNSEVYSSDISPMRRTQNTGLGDNQFRAPQYSFALDESGSPISESNSGELWGQPTFLSHADQKSQKIIDERSLKDSEGCESKNEHGKKNGRRGFVSKLAKSISSTVSAQHTKRSKSDHQAEENDVAHEPTPFMKDREKWFQEYDEERQYLFEEQNRLIIVEKELREARKQLEEERKRNSDSLEQFKKEYDSIIQESLILNKEKKNIHHDRLLLENEIHAAELLLQSEKIFIAKERERLEDEFHEAQFHIHEERKFLVEDQNCLEQNTKIIEEQLEKEADTVKNAFDQLIMEEKNIHKVKNNVEHVIENEVNIRIEKCLHDEVQAIRRRELEKQQHISGKLISVTQGNRITKTTQSSTFTKTRIGSINTIQSTESSNKSKSGPKFMSYFSKMLSSAPKSRLSEEEVVFENESSADDSNISNEASDNIESYLEAKFVARIINRMSYNTRATVGYDISDTIQHKISQSDNRFMMDGDNVEDTDQTFNSDKATILPLSLPINKIENIQKQKLLNDGPTIPQHNDNPDILPKERSSNTSLSHNEYLKKERTSIQSKERTSIQLHNKQIQDDLSGHGLSERSKQSIRSHNKQIQDDPSGLSERSKQSIRSHNKQIQDDLSGHGLSERSKQSIRSSQSSVRSHRSLQSVLKTKKSSPSVSSHYSNMYDDYLHVPTTFYTQWSDRLLEGNKSSGEKIFRHSGPSSETKLENDDSFYDHVQSPSSQKHQMSKQNNNSTQRSSLPVILSNSEQVLISSSNKNQSTVHDGDFSRDSFSNHEPTSPTEFFQLNSSQDSVMSADEESWTLAQKRLSTPRTVICELL